MVRVRGEILGYFEETERGYEGSYPHSADRTIATKTGDNEKAIPQVSGAVVPLYRGFIF